MPSRCAIRDGIKLWIHKEDAHSPRPTLAKFVRSTDISRLLSKTFKLPHPVVIKPDMTSTHHSPEAALLKQRWLLIQDGIPKQSIKIHKDKLFVNGHLYDQVLDSEFKVLHITLTASQRSHYHLPQTPLRLNLKLTFQKTPYPVTD